MTGHYMETILIGARAAFKQAISDHAAGSISAVDIHSVIDSIYIQAMNKVKENNSICLVRCQRCGHIYETLVNVNDPYARECPECSAVSIPVILADEL